MTQKLSSGELLFNYDWIHGQGDGSWCYELSDAQVMVVLAIANRMKWWARWYSPTGIAINTDWIDAIVDGLQSELMVGGCMPNLEFQIGDGTGGLLDGDLYWRINGGNWINIGHVVGADGAPGADGQDGAPGVCACPGTVVDNGSPSSDKKCDKAYVIQQLVRLLGGLMATSSQTSPASMAAEVKAGIYADRYTYAGVYNAAVAYFAVQAEADAIDWDETGTIDEELHQAFFCSSITSLGELSSTDHAAIADAIDTLTAYSAGLRNMMRLAYQAADYTYLSNGIFQSVVASPLGKNCTPFFCGDYDWEEIYDFTVASGFPTNVRPYEEFDTGTLLSSWASGQGWQAVSVAFPDTNRRLAQINITPGDAPPTWTLVNLQIELGGLTLNPEGLIAFWQVGKYSVYPDYTSSFLGYGNLVAVQENIPNPTLYYNIDTSEVVRALRLSFVVDTDNVLANLSGEITIKRVIIRGTGINPF